MNIICYMCKKKIEAGDGTQVEGKFVHKECEKKYYDWLGMMYRESMK